MTFLSLTSRTRLPLPFALKMISLVIIAFLAWLWGFKTNGVLENTMLFNVNPLGYKYLLDTYSFGIWPINREALYYLTSTQALLGVPDANIPFGNGYEISRTLYCLLLRSFWFLEPIMASFVLDVILWFLAALSAAYITATFAKNKSALWIAAFAVIFGQGFLHSVGEGIPHVLGYAGGFYIGALICLFRTWQTTCRFGEDLVIYIFIALWQIGYGTALFFLPLALFCTFYRLQQLSVSNVKRFLILGMFVLIALFPFFIISTIMKLISKLPGESGIVLEMMRSKYATMGHYFLDFAKVFLDGLMSLGPIVIFSVLALAFLAFRRRDYSDLRVLALIFLAQYGLMIALIVPLAGRGYATYNLILIPVIFLALIWDKISDMQKMQKYRTSIMALLVLTMLIYPHAMKLGYRLPNLAFHMGWLTKSSVYWKTYEIHTFQ